MGTMSKRVVAGDDGEEGKTYIFLQEEGCRGDLQAVSCQGVI